MERRRSRRVSVSLKAERISCTDNCSVFIENLSDTGIQMITAPYKKARNDYVPGKEMDLTLELSTGETIDLNCNIVWAYESSSEDLTKNVGLEIVDPPERYREFIGKLR